MKRIEHKEDVMSIAQAVRTMTGVILALKKQEVLLVTAVDSDEGSPYVGITLLPTSEGRTGCHWYPDDALCERGSLRELMKDGYELVYLEDAREFVNFLQERLG